MSAATDRWREARDAGRAEKYGEAGDTLAAILDRIEREAEECIAQEDDISTGWLLRIIREEEGV